MSDTIRTIRFNEEDARKIQETMEERGITFNAAVHALISGGVHVPKKEVPKGYKDIEEMATLIGMGVDSLVGQIIDLLNDGTLMERGGKIEVMEEEWVERLRDECHDKCVPVEKVVERAIKDLRRG